VTHSHVQSKQTILITGKNNLGQQSVSYNLAMSAFEEDQAMEAEALDSIFMDDFEQISSSPFHYRIKLAPYAPGDGEENHVAIIFQCEIPATYPDIAPAMEVIVEKGLSDEQRQELLTFSAEKAEENLGMAMVYTLCEEIQEWLRNNNEPGLDNSMYASMMRREQDKKKEEIASAEAVEAARPVEELEEEERHRQKILEGTPVSPETFSAWNKTFLEEMEGRNKVSSDEKVKMTGREYFAESDAWVLNEENTMIEKDEEVTETPLAVDQDLFADDDLDDLDDFSEDDDDE